MRVFGLLLGALGVVVILLGLVNHSQQFLRVAQGSLLLDGVGDSCAWLARHGTVLTAELAGASDHTGQCVDKLTVHQVRLTPVRSDGAPQRGARLPA